MVMHHRSGERRFSIESRVTVDTRPTTPVKPYWLSIVPCSADPQWTVPGSGTKTATRGRVFTMPQAGRIVAVGGHLHGGAQALTARAPAAACRARSPRSSSAASPTARSS
jgi:hypothetical protein